MSKLFVRASISGIVYLIDSQLGKVYTYNPEAPVYLGDLERIPGRELATSEGNLTGATLKLRPDWESVMKKLTAPGSKRYFFPILLLTLTTSVTPGYAEPLTSADKEVLRDSIAISARQDFLAQVSKMTTKTSNLVFHVDPLLNESLTRQIEIDSQFSSD